MRKAFYYDNAIPPKEWLIITSLLWNKIWISPLVMTLINNHNLFPELKNEFLSSLYQSASDIFDISTPSIDNSKFEREMHGDKFNKYKNITIEYLNVLNSKSITREKIEEVESLKSKAQRYLSLRDTKSALVIKKRLEGILKSRKNKMIEQATLYNHGFYNSEFKEYYPELDYFFDNESSFRNWYPNCSKIINHSIEALLPVNPESISIKQIKDFREETISLRNKFKIVADELLDKIMRSSSENEFANSLKEFETLLSAELENLKINYRNCKIAAVIKGIGVFATPSLLPFISSALSIPIFIPAGIVSALSLSSASVLSDIEKGKAEINKSPWGYLKSLDKLKNG